jgi:hypothetical protein
MTAAAAGIFNPTPSAADTTDMPAQIELMIPAPEKRFDLACQALA